MALRPAHWKASHILHRSMSGTGTFRSDFDRHSTQNAVQCTIELHNVEEGWDLAPATYGIGWLSGNNPLERSLTLRPTMQDHASEPISGSTFAIKSWLGLLSGKRTHPSWTWDPIDMTYRCEASGDRKLPAPLDAGRKI